MDIRDSGDAWVRLSLGEGEGVVLPPRTWRRVALPDADQFAVVARYAAGGAGAGGDDVVRLVDLIDGLIRLSVD